MPFYITRTNALNNLSISGKIFDWLCFLNNINVYFPRKKEKKDKMVYFLSKDIKKLKNDKILFKIHQISDWKRKIRTFKNNKKIDKISHSLRNIPSYNLDNFFKKKFIFFKQAFDIFKNLFSFILLISYKFENFSVDLNNFSKLFDIKKKFFFIFSSLNNIKKIFVSKYTIHLEFKIFGKKTEIYFPKKILFFLKRRFFDILSEYYTCLYNFILKKIIMFFNFQFLNSLYIEKFDIFKSTFEFVKRNYKSKQILLYSFSIFLTKNWKISRNFFKLNEYTLKKIPWSFSKNINLPQNSSLLKNPIFYIENTYSIEPFIIILKCLHCKILFIANHQKITHIICNNKNREYSLISLTLKFSLICNILNMQNILPIFLSRVEKLKYEIFNPFCLKIKKNKNKATSYFRQIYGKKKLLVKEIYDINMNNWIFSYIMEKKNKKFGKTNKFFEKKMTFAKIF
nr:nop-like protein [Cryptomonas curvata]